MSTYAELTPFDDPRSYELAFDSSRPFVQTASDLLRQDYMRSLQAGLVIAHTIEFDDDIAGSVDVDTIAQPPRHLAYAAVDKLGSLAFIGTGTEGTIQKLFGAHQTQPVRNHSAYDLAA